MQCPFCHRPMTATPTDWQRQESATFDLGVSTIQPGVTYERWKPVRPAAVEADVKVPLYQSLVCGAVGGVLVGGGAALGGMGWPSLLYAAIGGAGSVGASWLLLLSDHRRSLWEIEKIIGADLDGDGYKGPPPEAEKLPAPDIAITHKNENHTHWWMDKVPMTPREARAIAQAVLYQRVRFTRRSLVRAGAIPDDPDHYTEIFNAMLDQDLMRQRGKGGVLTQAGKDFLQQCITLPPHSGET